MTAGVPTLADVERIAASPLFAELRAAASAFSARQPGTTGADPLEQWSRRWEYPFALAAVEGHARALDAPEVLDAGSGFTFFPFTVADRIASMRVTCTDLDERLAARFAAAGHPRVGFRAGDLAAGLDVPDGTYDVALCISVLEHVRDRPAALRELRRVLRPGGLLVLSFDVSVDGAYPIPPPEAEELLAELRRLFPDAEVPDLAVGSDALTTWRVDASRMPWRNRIYGTLGSLRHGFLPRSFGYPHLTVWCGRLNAPQ